MEGLEVEWRRTDSETLVHLYQDGESRPEAQQQEYHDRAHFFTDQIQHGNFSLRLDNLRAEDEGKYRCKVYSQQDSGETEVQIKDVVSRITIWNLQLSLVFFPNICMSFAFIFWGLIEGKRSWQYANILEQR
ncbi:Myelin-oligodendrocyte glycoprotein [Anabarilius grahami]|uniref:Myelin-oligodendrocyte glycoprotein n=1 Tax=Anabarilius grahami TaxID=495550 RepID=A0A3N0YW17_ANAGA|nr:Myelin-oligodendrocyte glycoprotein [Anabarilius grahami]